MVRVPKPIIKGPYHADLLEQPQALTRAWLSLSNIPEMEKLRPNRIVLTGMGSSLFALYPLYLRLIAKGFNVVWVETAELLHYQSALLKAGTLVVAVSQSGRSGEIVSLMARCGPEISVVGVTNDSASPLAKRANYMLLLHAGPESTVSCKTYLNTLMVLDWLGTLLLRGDQDAKRGELMLLKDIVGTYVEAWRESLPHVQEFLLGVERIFVTGRGPSLANALTGGLILKESTRIAAEGMSCAAFRHGPLESVGPTVLVVICEGSAATSSLNLTLAGDVEAAGGRVAVLGPSTTNYSFFLPHLSPMSDLMLEMVFVQQISLAVAANLGIEAGRFEKASKITVVE